MDPKDRNQCSAAYRGKGATGHTVLRRSGESTLAGSKVSTPKLVGKLALWIDGALETA